MRKNLLQLDQNDHIKASVQKEEISYLINRQKLKQQNHQLRFNLSFNKEKLPRKMTDKKQPTFFIRTRSTQRKHKDQEDILAKEPLELEMKDKMNYFSVKQDY